jgi:hypothetical protein
MKARMSIENIDIILANTEYSYALPNGTRKFTIKLRDMGYDLQICFVSGDSNTTYITLTNGNSYTENEIKGTGSLYFRSNQANQVAEILVYV